MCGVVGIFGEQNVAQELYRGVKALQHRGQSSSGFITYDGNIYPRKNAGFVDELMRGYKDEADLEKDHPGPIGIGHTRYSTYGSDTWDALRKNAQPEYIINPFIASCHNGNIINGRQIIEKYNRTPRTECDIQYLLLPMGSELPQFSKINFDTVVEAGERVMELVKGSYSVLYLTAGKKEPYLMAMTDPHKIRPLVVGRKDTTWYLASESAVLTRLGVDEFQDVPGGTILSVDPKEDKPLMKRVQKKREYQCMFEFIYFADPSSYIGGRSVHQVRVEIGKQLGFKTAPDADIVVPVPESGRRYAIGFSMASGIPIEEGLKKDQKHRAFILQTQEQRDKKAKDNMTAIKAALDGKNVVLTDDSLVRGTNIKRVIEKVRDAGARKVHVRIGCPPLVAPCYLGIDMRSKREFVAIDQEKNEIRSSDEIAKIIGADSLAYGDIKMLRKSILKGCGDCDLCMGCINFPGGYPDDMQETVTEFLEKDKLGIRAYEC